MDQATKDQLTSHKKNLDTIRDDIATKVSTLEDELDDLDEEEEDSDETAGLNQDLTYLREIEEGLENAISAIDELLA